MDELMRLVSEVAALPRRVWLGAMLWLALGAAGCVRYPTFGFPIEEGNIEAGRQAFIAHRCIRCHSVAGDQLPDMPGQASPLFELGGETSYAKAYSELVSSIINPNHEISERYLEQRVRRTPLPINSPMPMPHIENMTVRQLIDLVAYLDSRYVLIDAYDREN